MPNYLSYKKIGLVSAPVFLSLVAQNVVAFTDTVFVGHLSEIALGACALASLYYIIFFMAGFGFGTGMQILIARRNSEEKFNEIGKIFCNGTYFLLFFSVACILFSNSFTSFFFRSYFSSESISAAANEYIGIRIYGLIFAFVSSSFRAFYVGIAKTKIVGINAIVMGGVNVIFDYALIFGKWGFPEMGIAGAALASVISEVVSLLFFIALTLTNFNHRKFQLFSEIGFAFDLMKTILKISVYTMAQNVLSIASWFFFFTLIEKAGERPLAVSNIIRSVYNLLLLPVWAFSATTNTFVSALLGENKPFFVISLIKRVTIFCTVVVAALCLIAFFFRTSIISIFTTSQSLIDDSQIPFQIICFSAVCLSVGYIVFSGISGTAKTNIALFIEFISLAIYLFSVYAFLNIVHVSIEYVWFSEIVYAVFIFLLSLLYLRFGKWKSYKI